MQMTRLLSCCSAETPRLLRTKCSAACGCLLWLPVGYGKLYFPATKGFLTAYELISINIVTLFLCVCLILCLSLCLALLSHR